ncbi:hypothetical protein ASG52_03190 [Methylobacterium sp. Leaf456]|uniref:hypothetical protein n=1 Tax=Methylobacterium sp. Leaf456 TaxID=1736382 RepID=UPI0006FD2455|nr:hypothetical protein [Methylobacterium sp. Leaf456]KQT57088.1 hypothetical protein ASG52_03190 [Methylobacterium sp. Leaf456]
MEHYKSTLGVTAAAISALVLAAQIMHAGPFAASPPRVERVVAVVDAVEDTAWVNPPARPQIEAAAQRVQAEPEAKPVETPVSPVAQAIAPVAAQTLAREAASAPRKVASAQRRKAAQRAARTRHATLETRLAAEAAVAQPAPAQTPAEPKRIDPIGDIIRGLGFGGQG